MTTMDVRSVSERGTIGEISQRLSPEQLQNHARQIVAQVLPKVNHDPLFHVWNELNVLCINDPKAKFIVDMVRSGSFPLQSFVGKTIESYYGGEGGTQPSGGSSGTGGTTGGGGGGGTYS